MNIESVKQCIENIEKELVELKAYVNETKAEKTPNQLRAELIEKAKVFVQTYTNGGEYVVPLDEGEGQWFLRDFDFVVNEHKRTIVVLCKSIENKVLKRSIAKLMPGDVFNEHIGKAIALGRALGFDVSEFEQAVQPTEFVKGQFVNYENNKLLEVDSIRKNVISKKAVYFTNGCWMHDYELTIINDTNAIYRGVE